MNRLAILDPQGKQVALQDIATASELLAIGEQARTMIRETERLIKERSPKAAAQKHVPYV